MRHDTELQLNTLTCVLIQGGNEKLKIENSIFHFLPVLEHMSEYLTEVLYHASQFS